jgi:RimJ/RimL family protein N-acetyltransferase
MLVSSPERPEVVLFGFTDQANIPSQRTLEAAGFVRKGLMRYDSDSEEETLLYILNWRLLQKKVREKLLEALQQVGP